MSCMLRDWFGNLIATSIAMYKDGFQVGVSFRDKVNILNIGDPEILKWECICVNQRRINLHNLWPLIICVILSA